MTKAPNLHYSLWCQVKSQVIKKKKYFLWLQNFFGPKTWWGFFLLQRGRYILGVWIIKAIRIVLINSIVTVVEIFLNKYSTHVFVELINTILLGKFNILVVNKCWCSLLVLILKSDNNPVFPKHFFKVQNLVNHKLPNFTIFGLVWSIALTIKLLLFSLRVTPP